jgi:hypothetical protein
VESCLVALLLVDIIGVVLLLVAVILNQQATP